MRLVGVHFPPSASELRRTSACRKQGFEAVKPCGSWTAELNDLGGKAFVKIKKYRLLFTGGICLFLFKFSYCCNRRVVSRVTANKLDCRQNRNVDIYAVLFYHH